MRKYAIKTLAISFPVKFMWEGVNFKVNDSLLKFWELISQKKSFQVRPRVRPLRAQGKGIDGQDRVGWESQRIQ